MKRLGWKSVLGTPRRAVFLKNACSGVPEALFLSKMLVRDSPKCCFYQKQSKHTRISCVFSKTDVLTPWTSYFFQKQTFQPLRRAVFIKNRCSNPLDELFFSKTDVPTPWTSCFSQKRMFQPLGRAIFFKNRCSNPLDELFFSKTDVSTPWTGLTIKNILQCGYS